MIAKMEAMDDPFEYADSLGCLKDIKRILGWKIIGWNQRIEDIEGEIITFEGHLDIMDAAINSELCFGMVVVEVCMKNNVNGALNEI
ncbi:hypothetical protein Tco_0920908 [Tanacetum coccineum]